MVRTEADSLERRVWDALARVADPEIPACSIVDLGMVERVEARSEVVEVDLLPTFLGCPAKDVIREDVEAALRGLGGEVRIGFVYDPPWTTERITDRGRARLREIGIAPEWEGGPPAKTGPVPVQLLARPVDVSCPFCGSRDTVRESAWGPTPCRTQHFCRGCRNPFEGFKEKAPLAQTP